MKHFFLFAILMLAGLVTSGNAQSLETAQYFDLGIRSLKESQPAKALEYFKESLDLAERSHMSPQFRAKIHYNIGVSLSRMGRYDQAVERYDEALKLSNGGYKKASLALSAAREKMKETSPRETEARAQAQPH